MKQHQVGKHFDGAVRNVFIDKRVFKGTVLKFEQQATIVCRNRSDCTDTRHPFFHLIDDAVKFFFMVFKKMIGYQLQVVA